MSKWASCIYEGRVRHRRSSPIVHHFDYPLFMMFLDLDELPELFRGRWLWSVDGWGAARFRRRDHLKAAGGVTRVTTTETFENSETSRSTASPGGTPGVKFSDEVRDYVAAELGRRPAGPVRLLTHLEYYGYRFNPVSFYYCYAANGAELEAIVAEINNTPWGEQHCYVLDAASSGKASGAMRWKFGKAFHISPFFGMSQQYDWRFTPPKQTLCVHMENFERDQRVFDATLTLRRKTITGGALAGVLARFPFMTLRVLAGIYWQAARLKWKGARYYPHPKTTEASAEAPNGC